MKVVTFTFTSVGGAQLSWTAQRDYVLTKVIGVKPGALVSWSPELNWAAYIAILNTEKAHDEQFLVMFSADVNTVMTMDQLSFEVLNGQKIFVSSPGTGGYCQIFLTEIPAET